jgi:hypothetical protein
MARVNKATASLKHQMSTKGGVDHSVNQEVKNALKKYQEAHAKKMAKSKAIADLKRKIFGGKRLHVPGKAVLKGKGSKKIFKKEDMVKKAIRISKVLDASRKSDNKNSKYREHLHRVALDVAKKRLSKRAYLKLKKSLAKDEKKEKKK